MPDDCRRLAKLASEKDEPGTKIVVRQLKILWFVEIVISYIER